MNNWSGWVSILSVAALFSADKNAINLLFKGDEKMEEKITKIKELILDKVTEKVKSELLTIDEYGKVLSLLGQILYDPAVLYSKCTGFANMQTKTEEI